MKLPFLPSADSVRYLKYCKYNSLSNKAGSISGHVQGMTFLYILASLFCVKFYTIRLSLVFPWRNSSRPGSWILKEYTLMAFSSVLASGNRRILKLFNVATKKLVVSHTIMLIDHVVDSRPCWSFLCALLPNWWWMTVASLQGTLNAIRWGSYC